MKIYIIGMVGSGKTTLAKELSNNLKIDYYELDNIVYNGNKKNDMDTISSKFMAIINKDNWIIEDVLRPFFYEALDKADIIIFMDTNKLTRDYRLIKRYIKRKLHLEKNSYTNNLKVLKQLLKWSLEYEQDKPNRLKLLNGYENKTIIIKNKNDYKKLLKKEL